jgi:hypothetical protein
MPRRHAIIGKPKDTEGLVIGDSFMFRREIARRLPNIPVLFLIWIFGGSLPCPYDENWFDFLPNY